MARRKEFKAIADGLVGFFISRNNDVYGYWGIGKLYSHMLLNDKMKLRIDLINKTINPPSEEFAVLVNELANRLRKVMGKRGLNSDLLKKAGLVMVGYPNEISPYIGKVALNRICCKLVILDDLNKQYFSEATTWCREHDPSKELKSAREY